MLHVHDRWSTRGGADWHLVSLLSRTLPGVRVFGLFGRADGSVDGALDDAMLPTGFVPEFIKKLDKKAPFVAETRVGERLKKVIGRLRPDLVHVHNILNPYLLNVLAETGPSVLTVQDHRFFCPGRGKTRLDGTPCGRRFGPECAGCFGETDYFDRNLELVTARLMELDRFTALVVLSNYMKTELVRAGIGAEKIRVIPPFVHGLSPVDEPASAGREILFAGRLVAAKGLFDLLEALALPDSIARVVIAGAGPGEETIRARAGELGLGARVAFVGWTPHRELGALLRRARAVVLPSRWQEPFGIAGLEAQWAGRPVIAYEGGGVRDWLEDAVTGLVIPMGNEMALAAAMNTLIKAPDLADELGVAGRAAVRERFRPEVLMDRLMDVYDSVTAGRGRP